MTELISHLKAWRTKAGLTQQELAERVGVSRRDDYTTVENEVLRAIDYAVAEAGSGIGGSGSSNCSSLTRTRHRLIAGQHRSRLADQSPGSDVRRLRSSPWPTLDALVEHEAAAVPAAFTLRAPARDRRGCRLSGGRRHRRPRCAGRRSIFRSGYRRCRTSRRASGEFFGIRAPPGGEFAESFWFRGFSAPAKLPYPTSKSLRVSISTVSGSSTSAFHSAGRHSGRRRARGRSPAPSTSRFPFSAAPSSAGTASPRRANI